jgi:acyl-CoA reductase-like NAD-dependent aldehyde dehydrogenase
MAQVRELLEEQVNHAVQMGARVLLGGRRLEGTGYFYAPTVLTDIPENSPAARGAVRPGPFALSYEWNRGSRSNRQ